MGRSAMEGVSADPRLKEAQMAALAQMQGIGAGGGMTDAERAQMARTQSEVAQADRGRRDAILQNMRARGMAGSGSEMLAQLASSQAATDRAAQQGLDINGMAQQRALAALQQAGAMAGGMRSQGFGEDSARAQAADAVARFNAANSQQANQFNAGMLNDANRANATLGLQGNMFNAGQANSMGQFNAGNRLRTGLANREYATDVAKYNTGAANQAGLYNSQGRQGVANAGVDATNKANYYNNVERPKTQFEMNAAKTKMQSDRSDKTAGFYENEADRKAKEAAGMLGGLTTLGAAGIGTMSDRRTKRDIADLSRDDITEFLRAVKPKSFKYKPKYANGDDGTKVGMLMQDVEGTKVGDMISRDGPDGMKAYDPQALQGVMLAALKHLSEGKKS
jgi:hypothetical protein